MTKENAHTDIKRRYSVCVRVSTHNMIMQLEKHQREMNILKGDLPKDISDTVEKAISEALDGLPKDLDIKVEINSKKIEGETK